MKTGNSINYKYVYDKIGRLILGKDLYKNREVCYTYDNSGNILTKSIDGEVTEYRYKEGTDQQLPVSEESVLGYRDHQRKRSAGV